MCIKCIKLRCVHMHYNDLVQEPADQHKPCLPLPVCACQTVLKVPDAAMQGAYSETKKEFKTAETVQTSLQAASPQQPANTAGRSLVNMQATTCEIQVFCVLL